MAQFRKRRANAGPNKNEEKIRRGQEAESRARQAGVLRERFPGLSGLTLELTATHPQSGQSDRETRVIAADGACAFTVPCPGRCGRGTFDLTEMVTAAVEARRAEAQASAVCQEPFVPGLPDPCGYKLECRLEARYSP